ncbi:MAG: transketolase C-terminal domain-containing protein, partial [Planctomycetota bacterium]
DADLSESTKTRIKSSGDFAARDGSEPGRNVRYGVREHAMGAVANGIAYHGGCRTYTATFFVFADYMRPAMRLAAMNDLPVAFVFTHDSVAVGEDGPTHQPVEQLMSLRVVPNLNVIRPADANETVEAWRAALARNDGPTALVLSRQGLPTLDRTRFAPAAGLERGGYTLLEAADPDVVLIGTGSEVSLACEVAERLAERGHRARVVSLPCWELFDAQDPEYRREVLGTEVPRVSLEAGATLGWERWIGDAGLAIGIDRFGSSAPGPEVMRHLGLDAEQVTARVERHLASQTAAR